jgi:hypothetical protein
MNGLTFTKHASDRMGEQAIRPSEVRDVLTTGEVIEAYPDDRPFPSRLMLGWVEGRPLHVVAAYRADDDETIVITAYEPDPARWERGFRVRKPRWSA